MLDYNLVDCSLPFHLGIVKNRYREIIMGCFVTEKICNGRKFQIIFKFKCSKIFTVAIFVVVAVNYAVAM